MKIKGIHHITLISSDMDATIQFYRDLLGLRLVKQTVNFDDPTAKHFYFGDEGASPGTLITFFEYRDMPRGHIGAGSTHHFAFEVETEEEQLEWQRKLRVAGISVTEVRDRKYFKSIYFSDPDGHILEIATTGPGFTVDEGAATLGTKLILPD